MTLLSLALRPVDVHECFAAKIYEYSNAMPLMEQISSAWGFQKAGINWGSKIKVIFESSVCSMCVPSLCSLKTAAKYRGMG